MLNNIQVMVVDDSALMRKIISDMINSETDIEVITTARNGRDCIDKIIGGIKPDVITLDVEMPIMDGIEALKEMKRLDFNIPVIVLSSITKRGVELTMDCLEAGAFDFQEKPSGPISLGIMEVKSALLEKIRMAGSRVKDVVVVKKELKEAVNKPKVKFNHSTIDAVVIGASTGGPKALYTVITALPKEISVPVFVVQHMPVGFTRAFAERLDSNSDIKVVESKDNMQVEINTVYIAPGGFHMEVGGDKRIHLNNEPSIWGVRPAVDKLFLSATKVYGANLLSVVLTGMGRDGAAGTVAIKENGGTTISEDKSTCTIYGMPKVAYETGMVDFVLPIYDIPAQIVKLIGGRR
jgi:two-component system chemotaxis response regulator CheB